mmetsp:Transcript_4294/g.8223  ORF Transcript_4294/g.8223 Transcript_4294/m.8223 type:complete len:343 (+) Transcript_4294:243-1271(+)
MFESGASFTHTQEAIIGPYTNLMQQQVHSVQVDPTTNNQQGVEFELCEYDDHGTENSSKSEESVISSPVQDYYELYYSIPSNLLFLFGSICCTIISLLDMYSDSNDADNDDDGDDDGNFSFYVYISLIGASLFVLNALVDLSKCLFLEKYSNFKKSCFQQEFLSKVSSALLFGCAAMLDLMDSVSVNVFSRYDGDDAGECMDFVSAHLYLLSAICAIVNSDIYGAYTSTSSHEMLNVVGDVMFMVGSLIDVGISYISDPDLVSSNQYFLLRLGMLSSVLWVIDALFYLVADVSFWKDHHHSVLNDDDDKEEDEGRSLSSSVQLPLLVQGGDDSSDDGQRQLT